MTQELRAQAGKQLQALSQTTNDQGMRDVLRALGDIITIDAISNSNGIAIGRNIRQVINTFNIPPEAMEVPGSSHLILDGHQGFIGMTIMVG